MKIYIYSLFFIIIALFACAPTVEYQSIDNFSIEEGIIENGEKITLFYSSATPKNEEKLTYFIHLIAQRDVTGDTLNILTVFNNGAGKGSSKNEFVFYTLSSEEGQIYFNKLKKSYELQKDIEEIKSIDRVSYDKRFNFMTNNNYPTVIGFIDKKD